MPKLPALLKRVIRIRFSGVSLASASHHAPSTAAMYFKDPLADLIALEGDATGRPVVQETPTLFTAGRAAVIVRYGAAREIAILGKRRFAKIYYLIDDALFAAGPGDGLPADYRRRLIAYRDGFHAKLLPLVTDVVAPSRPILDAYPGHAHHLLSPAQCHRPGNLDHHDHVQGLELVFAGTRSHLRDFAHIAPAVARFLDETAGARLTTFLGPQAPKPLRGLANALHHQPLSWPRYRRFVETHRFHLALCPALDTRFNRARSLSKIYDHGGFGAAGLYSRVPPFQGLIRPGANGLLLGEDPSAWLEALRKLAADRALVRQLARGGQDLSAARGNPELVRSFWIKALRLGAKAAGGS